MGIGKSEYLDNGKLRNHNHLVGKHQGCQVQDEGLISLRIYQLAECVSRQAARHDLQNGNHHRQLQCVKKQLRIIGLIPDIGVIFQFQILRDPLDGEIEDFQTVFKGRRQHPEERKNHS